MIHPEPSGDSVPLRREPLLPPQPVGKRADHQPPSLPAGEAPVDLALGKVDCPSREQFQRKLEPLPELPAAPPPAPPRFQFSVLDLMVVMVGVSAGLAGGTWMPAEVFAAVLGLVTLLGLLVVHFLPPETHAGKLIWGTLILAYFVAVSAALFRLR